MPDIVIETQKLHSYATRLEHINCRIRVLDARLDKLYSQVGLQGLFDLVVIDRAIGDSRSLRKSAEYLRTTASNFEKLEKNVQNYLPQKKEDDKKLLNWRRNFGYVPPPDFVPLILSIVIGPDGKPRIVVGPTIKKYKPPKQFISSLITPLVTEVSGLSELLKRKTTGFKSLLVEAVEKIENEYDDFKDDITNKKPAETVKEVEKKSVETSPATEKNVEKPKEKSDVVERNLVAGQVLENFWKNWSAVSPNGFTNYNGKGNCTWYADNRWSQFNPDYPLKFTDGSKNAKQWDDRIDKNFFNVNSTADVNNIKANAIAVSESGTYGHVAYIESVKDGIVYYTEDGESYTRPHTWAKDSNGNYIGPKVQSCTLAEFNSKFGKIITRK